MSKWSAIPLRFGLGVIFAAHGLQKAFGLFGGPGIKGFTQMLSSMGFAPAVFWAYLAAYTELISGICLILGLGTRIASGLLFILIAVAGAAVHLKNGFFLTNGGVEYTFMIACACLSLLFSGPGKFCVNDKY